MKVAPMYVACAAVVLGLLTAGCASWMPDAPVSQPQAVATQPATPPPAAKPAAPATPHPAPASVPAPSVPTPAPQTANKGAPPVARTPAPTARAAKPAAPPVAAPAAPAAAAAQTLDLNALKERLRATKAIGVFTKIALKNQVGDLLEQFSEYYQGKARLTMADLRQSYNLLMMKVLSLLQDDDQPLASAIVSSREAIWGLLANPTTFATLQS